jgi:hypothetical protein
LPLDNLKAINEEACSDVWKISSYRAVNAFHLCCKEQSVVSVVKAKIVLGELEKLRKAAISFVMSVRPSALNNSAQIGWSFKNFDI